MERKAREFSEKQSGNCSGRKVATKKTKRSISTPKKDLQQLNGMWKRAEKLNT